MLARDEDILTSRALLKQGKAIGTLLKSCLVNKSIDADEMLVGDAIAESARLGRWVEVVRAPSLLAAGRAS